MNAVPHCDLLWVCPGELGTPWGCASLESGKKRKSHRMLPKKSSVRVVETPRLHPGTGDGGMGFVAWSSTHRAQDMELVARSSIHGVPGGTGAIPRLDVNRGPLSTRPDSCRTACRKDSPRLPSPCFAQSALECGLSFSPSPFAFTGFILALIPTSLLTDYFILTLWLSCLVGGIFLSIIFIKRTVQKQGPELLF